MKLIKLLLLTLSLPILADISQYEEDGSIETVSGWSDLSSISPFDTGSQNCEIIVNNGTGQVRCLEDLSWFDCSVGGDPESAYQYEVGKLIIGRERLKDLIIINTSCQVERTITTNVTSTQKGIEGVAVKDGYIYVMLEGDPSTFPIGEAGVYRFIDAGQTHVDLIDPLFIATGCKGGGDIDVTDNSVVIVCQEDTTRIMEFDFNGNLLDERSSPLTNPEGVYLDGNVMVTAGEGGSNGEIQRYTTGVPRETEFCTLVNEGQQVEVYKDDKEIVYPISYNLDCPSVQGATGSLQ